jgi:hypothetical protein
MLPEALVLAISGTIFRGSESYMRLNKHLQIAAYPAFFFSFFLSGLLFTRIDWSPLSAFHFSLPFLYLRLCRSASISNEG